MVRSLLFVFLATSFSAEARTDQNDVRERMLCMEALDFAFQHRPARMTEYNRLIRKSTDPTQMYQAVAQGRLTFLVYENDLYVLNRHSNNSVSTYVCPLPGRVTGVDPDDAAWDASFLNIKVPKISNHLDGDLYVKVSRSRPRVSNSARWRNGAVEIHDPKRNVTYMEVGCRIRDADALPALNAAIQNKVTAIRQLLGGWTFYGAEKTAIELGVSNAVEKCDVIRDGGVVSTMAPLKKEYPPPERDHSGQRKNRNWLDVLN